MGYSIPAAMGAKYALPDTQVVAVCGDGSFQMSLMEMATMRQHGIQGKIVVLNNKYLGMVRQYQHFTYKDNYSVVDLSGSPDLSKIAEAYGFEYLYLENMDGCEAKIEEFLHSENSVLFEVNVDPMDLV